jgi:Domain of unknown function (DUF4129)
MRSPAKTYQRRSLASLVVIAAAFLFPVTVSAITLTEYQHKVKQAFTALDTLAQVDEHESESDFKNRLTQTIEAVRVALPEHVTVEENVGVCEVDNSALHKTLEDLKSLSIEDQLKKTNEVKETLQALEVRIAERIASTPGLETKEQAKLRLEGILARPEYATQPRGANALMRLIEDFFKWLRSFFPRPHGVSPGRLDWVVFFAQVLVIGVTSGALVYVLTTLLRRFGGGRFGRNRKLKVRKKEARIVLGERLEPEATSTDLLSQAEALVRSGDVRGAIRKAYIALLVELGDRKLLSLAQHKTNRDYLNSVRSLPLLFTTMRGLTDIFERHWYGLEQATPDDWQSFRAGYLAALQVRTN